MSIAIESNAPVVKSREGALTSTLRWLIAALFVATPLNPYISDMLRHKMKPGITGWAQINGWRGETETLDKMEKRVEFDLSYIQNWTLWLDIKIIFLTIFKGFVNKSAY